MCGDESVRRLRFLTVLGGVPGALDGDQALVARYWQTRLMVSR